jgi:AcrR family transcriptional regulator
VTPKSSAAVEGNAAATARGSATRQALLDSTIALIAETGFAATSTQAVLDHAGISRGSLLHHFPTRHLLMVAAAEAAMARKVAAVEDALSGMADPVEALRSFPAVQWRTQNDVPARALAEILLASRWDADLRDGLRATVVGWNRRIRDRVHEVAARVGLRNADELATEFSVLIAAMQGLAATSAFLEDEGTVARTLDALTARYDACLERGLAA